MDRRGFIKSTAAVVAGAVFGFGLAAKIAAPVGGKLVPRIIAKDLVIILKEESLIRGGIRLIPFSKIGFDPLALLVPVTETNAGPGMHFSIEGPIVDASEFESMFGRIAK